MSRTMEVKLVLGGMSQAASSIRRLQKQAQETALPVVDPDQTRVLQQSRAQIAKLPKFLMGPEQRLRMIAAQRGQLTQVVDEGRREAIGKDLDRAEFLAKRSIVLHQRRQNDPNALNSPGLLELFRDLNGLMKSMVAGNPGAALVQMARGVQLLSNTGGMNITQKLARTVLPGAANAGGGSGGLGGMLNAIPKVTGPLMLWGATVAAQISVTKLLIEQTQAAAASIGQLSAAAMESGGTIREVASLSAMGVATDQISGAADAFRSRISIGGDPMAMAAAMRAGIRPQMAAELGGEQNNAKLLQQALRHLRVVRDLYGAEKQLLEARRLGLAGMLHLVNVSQRIFRLQEQDAALREKVMQDSKAVQAAKDLNAQTARTAYNWETLKITLVKPFLPDVEGALGVLNKALTDSAQFIDRYGWAVKRLTQAIPILGDVIGMIEHLAILGGWISGPKKDDPADAHRRALDNNTTELRKLREGTSGGGGYAGNAIPRDLRGPILDSAMTGNTLRAGGFLL